MRTLSFPWLPAPIKFASTAVDVADPPQRTESILAKKRTDRGSPRSNYLFVSNVRFLAMVAIVAVHTIWLWGSAPAPASYLQVILLQILKFGTISFFLISGYLLAEGMTRVSRTRYFYRRLSSILVPWCTWSLVWFVIAFLGWRVAGGPVIQGSALHELMLKYVTFALVRSIYWFVPNFFVCLVLVLCLYERVPDYVQGPLFMAFSLFYGLNIYLNLVSVRHTAALLGYVFYMWLGLFAYKHRDTWSPWLEKVSWPFLTLLVVVAVITSLGEMHLLRKQGVFDEWNTLRISNQAYSVLMALLIAKSRWSLSPDWINVRSETFGIYLIHPILVQTFQSLFNSIPAVLKSLVGSSGTIFILISILTFAAIYLLSLLFAKAIRRISPVAWLVGQ